MNHHAKRLCKTLEALDFRRDYHAEEKSSARRVYRHPNEPDQALKVFDAMTDSTITIVTRKASKIADAGWSGPRKPQTIKERMTVRTRKARTQMERDEQARQERAEAAEREHRKLEAERVAALRDREIRALMSPGHGR